MSLKQETSQASTPPALLKGEPFSKFVASDFSVRVRTTSLFINLVRSKQPLSPPARPALLRGEPFCMSGQCLIWIRE